MLEAVSDVIGAAKLFGEGSPASATDAKATMTRATRTLFDMELMGISANVGNKVQRRTQARSLKARTNMPGIEDVIDARIAKKLSMCLGML